jgi:Tfp pilus assembly protein PilF
MLGSERIIKQLGLSKSFSFITSTSLGLLIFFTSFGCGAAPRTPALSAEVLTQLPVKANDPQARQIRQYQSTLRQSPTDVKTISDLAQLYFDIALEIGDPRYVGYAEALVMRYPNELPPELLFVRGLLRQYRHAFPQAIEDFSLALAAKPDLTEAHAWRAAIFLVQADYAKAKTECAALGRLSANTLQAGCLGLALAYNGNLAMGYRELEKGLANSTNPSNQLWLFTRLAEVAHWQGNLALAEKNYRNALGLGLKDAYLLAAWSDFLLDQKRPKDVIQLLLPMQASDPLLLRLALAYQQLAAPETQAISKKLEERFNATRFRGDSTHLAEEARFQLYLAKAPSSALKLAQANYAVQKEPRDARILLEAAQAAKIPEGASAVKQWLKESGFEGFHIHPQTGFFSLSKEAGK